MLDAETRLQWSLIRTPCGVEWSGRTRYAAAMYFCQRGDMRPQVLEVYRICSRIDAEDPLDVLRRWGIGADWLERMAEPD